ncbi:O-antigen ligase family protein [Candidatus Uhrbacteria bacterium]|nr:O-antigen ligase family protein [Candidatus Uhrbacteria bacterium]
MLFKPQFFTNLLLFLVFLLPWQTRAIISRARLGIGTSEYGTIAIYAVEVLLWIVFAIFLAAGRLRLPKDIKGRRLILILFAFLLFSFFEVFINPLPFQGFFSWIRIIDGVILFALLAFGGVKNNPLIYSFLAGIIVQAGIGIFQFSVQGISPSTLFGIARHDPAFLGDAVVETTAGRWLRAYGALPHPNILGGYLAIALIFLTTIIIWRKKNQKKDIFALFGLLILSAALFFTFSRGAIIAAGAGGLVFLWNAFLKNGDERFHRIIKFGLPVAVLWAVLGLTFVPLLQARFMGLGRVEQISTNERMYEYGQAFELLPRFAVVGAGIGAYTKRLEEISPGLPGYAYQPVHNLYLLLFIELGLIGAILFLVLILSFIRALNPTARWAAYPILAALLTLGFSDHYLWSLEAGIMLFWTTLGLLYNFRATEI